jgi:hypothetical protein
MARPVKERNVVGEHMRDLARNVAAIKIQRAQAYAKQNARNHIIMLFGADDD